jgi:hypothetical protein
MFRVTSRAPQRGQRQSGFDFAGGMTNSLAKEMRRLAGRRNVTKKAESWANTRAVVSIPLAND